MSLGSFLVSASLGVIAATAVSAPPPGPEVSGSVDLVLIVDTSASMRGQGGGQDIFGDVQKATKDLIGDLGLGDTVTLVSYDSQARVHPTVTLHSETERQRLYHLIDQLRADGAYTFTAEALRAGLAEAARLETVLPHHAKVVVILTDGINDPPPGARGRGPTLAEVAQPYAGRPWFVYQVQLGRYVDEELTAAIASFRGGVIHDPRGARLRELAERVLPKPRPISWTAEPAELALELRAPKETVQVRLRLLGLEELPLSAVRTQLDWHDEPPGVACQLQLLGGPSGEAALLLACGAQKRVPNGQYRGTLVVALGEGAGEFTAHPLSVPVALQVAMEPPRWPYVAGAIAGLTALALGFLAAIQALRRRRLFGTLEYWRRGDAGNRWSVPDLGVFGTRAVLGSRQLPLSGVNEPLGVLRTRVVDGVRHVVLTPQPGLELVFRGRREAELVLFDTDEFDLGGWCFRYRGGVPRRRH